MILALITLAVLQYRWLGSVSEAEKKRLKEGLDASIENFISDFNEAFALLTNDFQIQVTNTEPDWSEQLNERFEDWKLNTMTPDLLEHVFVVRKKKERGETRINVFILKDGVLKAAEPDEDLEDWLDSYYQNIAPDEPTQTLGNLPDFQQNSFISLPIKQMNMMQVTTPGTNNDIQLNLNVELLDDMVVLDLNDEYIKNTMIPAIAKRYFSESFEDQYHVAILKDGEPKEFYYNNSPGVGFSETAFTADLSRPHITSFVFLDNTTEQMDHSGFPTNDSFQFSFKKAFTQTEDVLDSLVSADQISSINVFSSSSSNIKIRKADSGKTVTMKQDTTINASFPGLYRPDSWQIWLDFKSGSLDKFVAKTRNRNLAISFGILAVLGISVVLIVIFSQRSRDLAEQQMLFVAGVSHELRTPITVIRSAAENLKEGVVQTEERKKEYAELMLNEGRRLSDMVDQIMEFSGIQTGKRVYNFSEVDINNLMDSVLEDFKSVLAKANIQLEYSNTSKKETIYADRDAIYLSISNLLNNAIKFSGESKKIRLSVNEVQPKDTQVAFIVQDYGMGIPDTEKSEVFKPFFRGKRPMENQVIGNGIGLSLVKKVAEAHGGEIRLKSEVGVGSTFILLIPIHHG